MQAQWRLWSAPRLTASTRSMGGLVDHWVRIPMAGGTESLNVAMAATLLAFEYRRSSSTTRPTRTSVL